MWLRGTSAPVLSDCVFDRNGAVKGGGIYADDGTAIELVRCEFTQNSGFGWVTTNGAGGAIFLDHVSEATIRECTVRENDSDIGGALCSNQSPVTVMESLFEGNESAFQAGAIELQSEGV